MIMAVAPPPPLQMLASPYLACFSLRVVMRLWTILAPLTPIGCPIATAPPRILTFYLLIPSIFIMAIGTIENA